MGKTLILAPYYDWWRAMHTLVVVSRHFAFRGPLASAFLNSFSRQVLLFGFAAEGAQAVYDITRQMLWESFLEQFEAPVLSREAFEGGLWDYMIVLDGTVLTARELSAAKKVFFAPAERLCMHDLTEARKIRDQIKNDMFVLLRDSIESDKASK